MTNEDDYLETPWELTCPICHEYSRSCAKGMGPNGEDICILCFMKRIEKQIEEHPEVPCERCSALEQHLKEKETTARTTYQDLRAAIPDHKRCDTCMYAKPSRLEWIFCQSPQRMDTYFEDYAANKIPEGGYPHSSDYCCGEWKQWEDV